MEHHLRRNPHRDLLVEKLVASDAEFSHVKLPSPPSGYLQYQQGNWNASRNAPEVDRRPLMSKHLALSWVLILVIAPLLVALLAWFLVLLLRRANQTRFLVTRHISPASPAHSTSSLSISSSSSVSSSSRSDLRLNGDKSGWKLSRNVEKEAEKSLKTVQRLMEHMNLYLLTLTYQQILACMVAFSLAIVNIMRMRNLFYCNLVIFILITSKLLNLLTLVTFSISKLFILFRLRPLPSGCRRSFGSIEGSRKMSSDDDNGDEEEDDGEDRGDESDREVKPGEKQGTSGSSASSSQTTISSGGGADGCEYDASGTQMGAESELIELGSDERGRRQRRQRRQCCGSPGEGDGTNATIRRLITKPQTSGKHQQPTTFIWSTMAGKTVASGDRTTKVGLKPAGVATGAADLATIKPASHEARQRPKLALCRLFSLILLASGLALVCLYLRLMPPTSPTLPRAAFPSPETSQNNSRTQPTTTTTSTTTTSLPPTTTPNEPARPNYQGWATRLQQSPAWRQLVDQYNLGTFLQVLLDTQLQTSRFSCSIIGGNYSASSRLSMATAYGALVALVFLVSLTIGQLGGKQLRKFEICSLAGSNSHLQHGTWLDSSSCSSSSGFSSNTRQPTAHLNMPGKTDSNRKRYSELLKQNIRRHHRSAFEVHQQQQLLQQHHHQQHQHQNQPAAVSLKNAPGILRGSSSMSSLLTGPNNKGATKLQPAYVSASSRHQHAFCTKTSSSQVSQHQLAWIPLGGAATVASLSNMKLEAGGWSSNVLLQSVASNSGLGSGSAGRIYRQRRKRQAGDCQLLGSIDERQTLAPALANQHHQSTCEDNGRRHRRRHLRLQFKAASWNRISVAEIRADLKLAQAMILFGQLLDQAPVLLLLTLTCLLPEGTLEANWNSAHDNAFVWLTLVEALLFPSLLCLLDSRLRLALKRSLRCSSANKASGLASLAELGTVGGHQLMLRPSLEHHPDLKMLAGVPTRNPLYQPPAPSTGLKSPSGTCHTGPPYPPIPSFFNSGADDGSHTLRANFALVGKNTQRELMSPELMPTALLAHQRHRRQERRRRRPKSALLNVTRRLLKLGRTKAYQRTGGRRAGAGSGGYSLEGGGAPGNNSTSSSAGGGTGTNQRGASGRLSPTSSLSTLIRKFNHDNYTSVCQQYQQRKAQVAREQLVELGGANTSSTATREGCLIEGLDMPSGGMQLLDKKLANSTNQQDILCRKGGLYYNYCLDSEPPAPNDLGARMNPMLGVNGLQPFVVEAVGGSMSSLMGDNKLDLQASQTTKESQNSSTTIVAEEQLMKPKQQVKQLEGKKEGYKDKKKLASGKKTSAETSKESNKNGKARKKAEEQPGEEKGSRLASKDASTTIISTTTTANGTTNNNNNNQTIISNLTSVQELLDKMNGMMGINGQQLVENKANPISQLSPQPQISNNGHQLKPTLNTCANNNNNNNRQSSDGKLAIQERSGEVAEYMSLDYASLRSLEDALSLVSVSSEFEYHNINQDELRTATSSTANSARPIESRGGDKRCKQLAKSVTRDSVESPQEEKNLLLLSTASSSLSSSSSSVANSSTHSNKRLNDIRFPSFLPNKPVSGAANSALPGKPLPEVSKTSLVSERNRAPRSSARGSSKFTNSSSQANFQKRANSSSLLNLTAAKFAAVASASNGADASVERKLARQELPHQLAGSSNTIVKQKGVGSKAVKVLVDGGNSEKAGESSLRAAESGHVRARIRKMEQQSVPNLNSSQQVGQQQQQLASPSNSKSRLPTLQATNSSMIPVTSKLPVPTAHLLQHQRASQPLISSSTTDINSQSKKTTRQQRVGSSSGAKYR